MPDTLTLSGQARSALQFLRGASDVRRLLVNEWAEMETGTIAVSPWLAERRYGGYSGKPAHKGWKKKSPLSPAAVSELTAFGLVELDRYGNGCRLLRLSEAGKGTVQ